MGNALFTAETKKKRIHRRRLEFIESLMETDSNLEGFDTSTLDEDRTPRTGGLDIRSTRENRDSTSGYSISRREDTFSGDIEIETVSARRGRDSDTIVLNTVSANEDIRYGDIEIETLSEESVSDARVRDSVSEDEDTLFDDLEIDSVSSSRERGSDTRVFDTEFGSEDLRYSDVEIDTLRLGEDIVCDTRVMGTLSEDEDTLFDDVEIETVLPSRVSDTRVLDDVTLMDDRISSSGPCSRCPADHCFPFENLVFEGGGNKGLAYCGAVKYLEEIGVMQDVKRLGGASAGAMTAALLAVGCSAHEIETFLGQNLQSVFLDGSYFKAIFNLFWNFGFHPADKLYEWLGDTLKKQTGSADVTFEKVRKQFGKELCVVVTNINWGRTEYCHPKTTPDMPVRLALRMSSTIPGLFTAKSYSLLGESDVFVDGGVLCNYPIHCFDGWFLSMSKEDNFIYRLHQHGGDLAALEEEKFKQDSVNRTLGFQLFSEHEPELRRLALERKCGTEPLPVGPNEDTKLYRKWLKQFEKHQRAKAVHKLLREATEIFLNVVTKHMLGNVLDRERLNVALSEGHLSQAHLNILFGEDVSPDDVFDCLDHDKDGQIDSQELVAFVGSLGIHLESSSCLFRRPVNNLFNFASSIESTITVNTKRICVKPTDVDRTVGINTGHVTTTDFVLEKADKEFLVQRGYNACKTFLQSYVQENNLPFKN